MDKRFINETNFSRILSKMSYNYSTDKNTENLKDVVTITAFRDKLIDIPKNAEILNDYVIDKKNNIYDIDGILKHLKNQKDVLIDKEITVAIDEKLYEDTGEKVYKIQSVNKYTRKENKNRNYELKEKLRNLKYDVTPIKGSYIEDSVGRVDEESFFVVNINKDKNFFDNIQKLSIYYNQDCFMIKAACDNVAFLIGTNDASYPGYDEMVEIGELKINNNVKNDNFTKIGNYIFAFQDMNEKLIKESIMDTGKLDKYDLEEFGIYEDINDFPFFNGSWQHILHKNTITNGISYKTLEEEFDNDVDLWLEYNKKSNNKGCWNCIDCVNCIECIDCVECDTCVYCHDCYRCEKCLDCFHCQRCKHCCNLDTDVRQEYLGMKYEDDMEDDDGSGEWLYYFNFDEADKYYESRKTTATGKLLKESKDVNYEIVLDALEDYFTTNKNFYTDNRSYTTSDLINKYGISKSLDKVEGWEDVENLSIEYGLNKDDKENVKSIVNNYEKKLKKQVLKRL